eukprot:COSAG02_NODE_10322_length_1969_cov_1.114973_1_plen_50_part_00
MKVGLGGLNVQTVKTTRKSARPMAVCGLLRAKTRIDAWLKREEEERKKS